MTMLFNLIAEFATIRFVFKAKGYIVCLLLIAISAAVMIWNWKNSWLPAISLSFLFRFAWWFILALFNVGLIFLAGHVINQRLLAAATPKHWIWQAAYAWASGSIFFIISGILLLLCKLYAPISWNIFSITILIIAISLYYSEHRSLPLLSWQKIKSHFVAPEMKKGGHRPSLLAIVSAAFLLLAFTQLFIPPNSRDEIVYHLLIPRLWEFQHHFWMPTDSFLLLFPANMELLWGFAMSQGGIHIPRFITFVFGLLTILCLRQTFKEWGINRWLIDFSTAFIIVTPLALIGLATCYVEWPMFFFLFTGWIAAKQFLATRNRANLVLTTLCWGCSLGIKYTALPFVWLLLFDLCWRLFRLRMPKNVGRTLLLFLLSALILFGPWALRNFIVVGNPLHPLSITRALSSKSGDTGREFEKLTSYSGLTGLWKLNPWLFHATFEKKVDDRMHIGWPILLILILMLGRRWRKELPWHAFVFLTTLFFCFGPSPRIYFPLMAFALLFLPLLARGIQGQKWAQYTLQTLLLVYALPCFAAVASYFFMTANRADQDYLFGIKSDTAYLQTAGIMTPVHAFVQKNTPMSSRFWIWCEDEGFYFGRWVMPTAPFGIPVFLKLLKQGGETALDEKLIRDRIDYLVINTEKCNIQNRTVHLDKTNIQINEEYANRLGNWIKKRFMPIARDHRFELYQIIPVYPFPQKYEPCIPAGGHTGEN